MPHMSARPLSRNGDGGRHRWLGREAGVPGRMRRVDGRKVRRDTAPAELFGELTCQVAPERRGARIRHDVAKGVGDTLTFADPACARLGDLTMKRHGWRDEHGNPGGHRLDDCDAEVLLKRRQREHRGAVEPGPTGFAVQLIFQTDTTQYDYNS